jgi:predicted transcriptional regulator
MENETEKLTHDIFYKILECCIKNPPSARSKIAEYVNISGYDVYIALLEDSGLIRSSNNFFSITAAGMSAFLSLQAQKQADELSGKAIAQARKATYIAGISVAVSIFTMLISLFFFLNK